MKYKLTPAEARAKLVEALRSGDYKQGMRCLRDRDDKFCCLGVGCDLYLKIEGQGAWQLDPVDTLTTYDFDGGSTMLTTASRSSSVLPARVMQWLGFSTPSGCLTTKDQELSERNDNGEDFPTIANRIEQNEVLLSPTETTDEN